MERERDGERERERERERVDKGIKEFKRLEMNIPKREVQFFWSAWRSREFEIMSKELTIKWTGL